MLQIKLCIVLFMDSFYLPFTRKCSNDSTLLGNIFILLKQNGAVLIQSSKGCRSDFFPPCRWDLSLLLLPLNKLKLTGNKLLQVSIISVLPYKNFRYRSFQIYFQGCGLKRNTVNSPQKLCKFSKGIPVSRHRFDERRFIHGILQIIIILPA